MALYPVELVSIPASATLKIIWNVLKYVPVIDTLTQIQSDLAEGLEVLANFTNTSTKTGFETAITNNPYDMFFYFGHSDEDCLVNESGLCVLYPREYLADKWIVLVGCLSGMTYARSAVRDHGAVASLGYSQLYAVMFTSAQDDFIEGSGECMLKAQKVLLDTVVLDEEALLSAYAQTKAEYEYWADYYTNQGDAWSGGLLRANGKNLVHYSKWDEDTTIDINVTPTPTEIYHFGSYVGRAPLENYALMSGGNVFWYKSIGCVGSWFILNLPKAGGSYTLTPMGLDRTTALDFGDSKVYVEIKNSVDMIEDGMIQCMSRNYGDSAAGAVTITNSKDWPISSPVTGIVAHSTQMSNVIIDQTAYTRTCLPQHDTMVVTVNVGSKSSTADVDIRIPPNPECIGPRAASTQETFVSANISNPAVKQYNKMSTQERTRKNIYIHRKWYSPEDMIHEMMKQSDIGAMFF